MLRTFKSYNSNIPCNEVVQVSTETGEVYGFCYTVIDDKYLLKFAEWRNTLDIMGYKQIKAFVKRQKELGRTGIDSTFLDHLIEWRPEYIGERSLEELQKCIIE